MEIRKELIQSLLKSFLNDLGESAKPLTVEETINFIGVLMEYLKGVYNDEPSIPEYDYEGNPFDEDEFIETHLLKPYRNKMVGFIKTRLTYYFAKDEFKKTQLFQKLKINEAVLNGEEYQEYILRIYVILRNIKTNLYLKPIEQTEENLEESQKLIASEEELVRQGFKPHSKEFTRTRQVLLYYFMLQVMGLTKLDAFTSDYSRFAHFLFYLPYQPDKLGNSEIYKMLKKAPNLKENKSLIKDLEFIRELFELIKSEKGVALVQKEIDSRKK